MSPDTTVSTALTRIIITRGETYLATFHEPRTPKNDEWTVWMPDVIPQ